MKIQRQFGESVIRQPLATNDAKFYVHACGPAGSEAALGSRKQQPLPSSLPKTCQSCPWPLGEIGVRLHHIHVNIKIFRENSPRSSCRRIVSSAYCLFAISPKNLHRPRLRKVYVRPCDLLYCLSNSGRCRRCGSLITRHMTSIVKRHDLTLWASAAVWRHGVANDVALCATQSSMVDHHAVDDCSLLTLLILTCR